jgi:hypothetical protein
MSATNYPHLIPATDCPSDKRGIEYRVCDGSCSAPVRQHAETGRWFITMGHPGYNSPANNRDGYTTEASARAAIHRYATRRPKVRYV